MKIPLKDMEPGSLFMYGIHREEQNTEVFRVYKHTEDRLTLVRRVLWKNVDTWVFCAGYDEDWNSYTEVRPIEVNISLVK